MIGVVEVGLGNTTSVHNMLRHLGIMSKRVQRAGDLHGLAGLILPGVGAFDTGMTRLDEAGLVDPIRSWAQQGRPTLGICLGMHLLCSSSAEGSLDGLALLPSRVVFLGDKRPDSKVPHVGWEQVVPTDPANRDSILSSDGYQRFYFTHSFGVELAENQPVAATADFDGQPFAAVLAKENICAVQFHPEKSHRFGMELLTRFWEKRCSGTA